MARLAAEAQSEGLGPDQLLAELLAEALPAALAEAASGLLKAGAGVIDVAAPSPTKSAPEGSLRGAPDHAVNAQPSSAHPTASRGLLRAVGGRGPA